MTQPPRRLLNYTLLREIGRGGMASVWYAENSVGRKFAIKVLKPELVAEESSIAERFRNEAQIMVRLEHPAILRVEDFFEEDTTLAIIMEYLAGHDLNQHIAKYGPLPEDQAVAWFGQILDAFAYVHQKGYFHRDVKPSNLFLTDNGDLKVMDFGIAKIVGSDLSLTQTDLLMGSPLYMSPEQITAPKSVDFRTDIYSLGVTLYTLLAGRKPYNDAESSMFTIQTTIVKEPLPWLPHASAIVNEAIQRATQKIPANRFSSCAEFAKALSAQPSLDHETIVLKSSVKSTVASPPDDATVLQPVRSAIKAVPPTDEATLVRPQAKKHGGQPHEPALPPPKPFPSAVSPTAESPTPTLARIRNPLIVAGLVGVLALGISGWGVWSKQNETRQMPVSLRIDSTLDKPTVHLTDISQANADLARAISFYGRQQYDSAMLIFKQYRASPVLADHGDAMADLGIIYYYGSPKHNIPQDLALATEWLQKSVQKQTPKAFYFLGLLKDGVDFATPAKSKARGRNAQAVDLYKQAASLGEPYAQATLGELFLMKNQYVSEMDPCQVLDYVKQATTQNLNEAVQIYNTLKESGQCGR